MHFIFLLLIFSTLIKGNLTENNIIFTHPANNSKYISIQTSPLIRFSKNFVFSTDDFITEIRSNKNGLITHNKIKSENTLILKIQEEYETSDNVTVKLLNRKSGDKIEFKFTTNTINNSDSKFNYIQNFPYIPDSNQDRKKFTSPAIINGISVPSDFPYFEPSIFLDETSNKKIFLNNWNGNPYILIFNNDGTPYSYQKVEDRSRDFKIQPNGLLTRRYIPNFGGFVGMDSSFAITDTFMAANGYGTDEHELYMTADGHYFLIALGWRQIDMSQIIPGGNPNAWAIDNHIQEFDENKNIIFEWLSYQHFNIEDAVHEYLLGDYVDYVHTNSIAVDYDSNIIISSRNQSEVTKISRQTGEVIWSFGGENNEFTLINDEFGISYQHFAQPVEGKPDYYLIFDNGNYHIPPYSRAVEFHLDTVFMQAIKVWEYRNDPDYYTWWMGNAIRLENGNTFINFADGSLPKAVEVSPSGTKIYEANFSDYIHTYRSFKFDWNYVSTKPYLIAESFPDKVSLIYNKFGDTAVSGYIIYSGKDISNLTAYDTTDSPLINITNLENNTRYYFKVTAFNENFQESGASNIESVFVRYTIPGTNYVLNSDFSQDKDYWFFNTYDYADASSQINSNEEYEINISNPGPEIWSVQLTQDNIPLINNYEYLFEFEAYSTTERPIEAKLEKNGNPYNNYSKTGYTLLNQTKKKYSFNFKMEDPTDYYARITFNLGLYSGDVIIDNVILIQTSGTSVNESKKIPESFYLSENYPNPFNPQTSFDFFISNNSYIKIEVFNVMGERIIEYPSKLYSSGKHHFKFNGSNLSSGIYFLKLDAEENSSHKKFTSTKKMILLK